MGCFAASMSARRAQVVVGRSACQAELQRDVVADLTRPPETVVLARFDQQSDPPGDSVELRVESGSTWGRLLDVAKQLDDSGNDTIVGGIRRIAEERLGGGQGRHHRRSVRALVRH
jgi:hypothetical protein